MKKKVYLIGGPPGAGKSTLGTALAVRLGISSLTIDDLVTAVQAVTTPESHPGLHLMWNTHHTDYFTNRSPEELIEDAKKQHRVTWPFIERVVRKHAKAGPPVVIDGWHLWPEHVNALGLDNLWAGWIYANPEVLKEREGNNTVWLAGSSDPERMLENFLARSLWYNDAVREQVIDLKMNVLVQDGTKSVEQLCEEILAGG
jgi:2-phosphoglycerate kinase